MACRLNQIHDAKALNRTQIRKDRHTDLGRAYLTVSIGAPTDPIALNFQENRAPIGSQRKTRTAERGMVGGRGGVLTPKVAHNRHTPVSTGCPQG